LTKDYYPKRLNHLRTDPSPICDKLEIYYIPPVYNGIPIYIDGGNIIRKFNKVILTDKIFKDNRHIPQKELKRILKDYLEVDQVIIIPREPGEDSGHSDGMIRFFKEDTVLVNDYLSVDTNRKFVKDFYRSLTESGLKIIEVPYKPVDGRINGFQPSTGIYINFLQVNEKIFLPTFDDPITDDHSISVFRQVFGSGNIIPVPSRELSLLGGVLNCISWEISDS
jgi:agmatine deiminase